VDNTAALFRSVNDRIRELGGAFPDYDFVCECEETRCVQWIRLTAEEYELVRADPRQFVVVPGHEAPEREDVVERRDGFVLIRKHLLVPVPL
jgi:hypothetical protein